MLDLYAGTGAVGIEALSRGAAQVTFVESASAAQRVLQANLARCSFGDKAEVLTCRVDQSVMKTRGKLAPFDIVFADPPYAAEEELRTLSTLLSEIPLAEDCLVILEYAKRTSVPDTLGNVARIRQYVYGDTCLSLYRPQ